MPKGDDLVVDLLDSTFNKTVMKSQEIWLVEFFAPWCGHCKKLEPKWRELAKKYEGKIKFGKVNTDKQKKLQQHYNIESYPTIKVFEYGNNKTDDKAYDFELAREVSIIS
jgi:protein disulfide-isomerase A6